MPTKSAPFYISNAPVSTQLRRFVWLSGVRWAIEQCFEEAKSELGMDHYEVRKYPGWNHHMLTSMLAHLLPLAPEHQVGEKKHPPLRCRSLGSCYRACCP